VAGEIQQVYINAVRYGFQNASFKGETLQQYGSIPFQFPKGVFASFNWEASQDSGEVQGNRIQSLGVTDGYGLGKGDFEILLSEARDWQKLITGSGQFPVMSVFFNYRVILSVNNGQDVTIIEVNGMKINNVGAGMARGNDAATLKYSYRAGQVFVDGIAMFGDPAF
jgi:hypothetical protein